MPIVFALSQKSLGSVHYLPLGVGRGGGLITKEVCISDNYEPQCIHQCDFQGGTIIRRFWVNSAWQFKALQWYKHFCIISVALKWLKYCSYRWGKHIDFGAVDSSLGDATTALELCMKHDTIFGHLALNLSQPFMWIADWLNRFTGTMCFSNMISELLNYIGKIWFCIEKIV